jgi:hypothetical protein
LEGQAKERRTLRVLGEKDGQNNMRDEGDGKG